MSKAIWILAALLYGIGAALHLQIFTHPSGTIWGDSGDGFFNLWILTHVTETLRSGAFDLANSRTFWPHHQAAFFWSDNLIAFTPVFAIARLLTTGMLDAFRLTGLLLSVLHFAALCLLFDAVYRIVRSERPHLHPATRLWVPIVAYLTHFSPAVLINHFLHIQNLATMGVFVLLAAGLNYQRSPSGAALRLMALALIFLLYTTPYFAVAAIILLLLWGLTVWFSARATLFSLLRKDWWFYLALAPFALALFAFYRIESGPSFLPSSVQLLAIDWTHLFRPEYGTLRLHFEPLTDWPRPHSEQIGWLGPGVGFGFIAALGWGLWSGRAHYVAWLRRWPFWVIGVSLIVPHLKIREIAPVLTIYHHLAVLALLLLSGYVIAAQWRVSALRGAFALLTGWALLMYGIAFGPKSYVFLDDRVGLSIWQFFYQWLPGFDQIRAIGRMAYLGQGLISALVLAALLVALTHRQPAVRRTVWVLALLALTAQVWDLHPIRARAEPQQETRIQPTAAEAAFWQTVDGPLLVLPGAPFHGNTTHMLYFAGFRNILLANGYSGRSTPAWDQLMELEVSQGLAAPAFYQAAQALGIQRVAARMDLLYSWQRADLASLGVEPEFANERWLVFRIPQ